MSATGRLPRKPEARSEKVEDLIFRVMHGLIRVPEFQRPLRWGASDVVDLFDSIYRGYPVGSLLFSKRPAHADRLKVGPMTIDAPETAEAWWVVDGQQRLTSLAVCLARPTPLASRPSGTDPFVLYFDPGVQSFEPPPTSGIVPSTRVPLPHLLDSSELSEWMHSWEHGQNQELRRVVFDAGSRIREYSIPLYLIQAEDDEESRKLTEHLFFRINTTGKPLEWTDVHKALFSGGEAHPSTLVDLSRELADVGMGSFDERRLLTSLEALRGEDPTRTLGEHVRRNPEVLRGAVQEGLPVLRRVLSFLREDAEVPHLRLLPKSILVDVLTRFFALHADPNPRTRTLLARWFWRAALGAARVDDRTLRRAGISAVSEDEEASVQALLRLVRKDRPRPLDLPPSFDARADASRIFLLALAHLGPGDLTTGRRLDIAGLVEDQDKEAFARVFKETTLAASRGPANRIFQAKGAQVLRLLRKRIADHGNGDPILAGHVIDARAAELIADDERDAFLAHRAQLLTREVQRFAERVAAWEYNDRPSVDYLLTEVDSVA
jgi:Protein of unknown function DUF262